MCEWRARSGGSERRRAVGVAQHGVEAERARAAVAARVRRQRGRAQQQQQQRLERQRRARHAAHEAQPAPHAHQRALARARLRLIVLQYRPGTTHHTYIRHPRNIRDNMKDQVLKFLVLQVGSKVIAREMNRLIDKVKVERKKIEV